MAAPPQPRPHAGLVTRFSELERRLDLGDVAEWWLLHYVWHVHRCGVLAVIDEGTLTALLPFANTAFDNRAATVGAPAWRCLGSASAPAPAPAAAAPDGLSVAGHYAAKAAALGSGPPEPALAATHQWWLNGHVVCNVVPPDVWGTRGLAELRAMVEAALALGDPRLRRARLVLNKRDAPLLRVDGTTPFDALFGLAPGVAARPPLHPLWRGVARLARPLSFYVGPGWADVAMPIPEHWALATTRVAGTAAPPWDARESRAVFRGTATGPGATLADNQRLRLAAWARAPAHAALADVGLTAFSTRDQVWAGGVTFMDAAALRAAGIGEAPRMEPGEQAARFKYQIYADGHAASSRLAWCLASGSLVLRVASPARVVAPDMWLSAHLRPGEHYLPVAADLSDLAGAIRWARDHDAEARAIAERGRAVVSGLLTRDAIAAAMRDALLTATAGVSWH